MASVHADNNIWSEDWKGVDIDYHKGDTNLTLNPAGNSYTKLTN